jgi:ABC-type transporter Mla subunit MlaD
METTTILIIANSIIFSVLLAGVVFYIVRKDKKIKEGLEKNIESINELKNTLEKFKEEINNDMNRTIETFKDNVENINSNISKVEESVDLKINEAKTEVTVNVNEKIDNEVNEIYNKFNELNEKYKALGELLITLTDYIEKKLTEKIKTDVRKELEYYIGYIIDVAKNMLDLSEQKYNELMLLINSLNKTKGEINKLIIDTNKKLETLNNILDFIMLTSERVDKLSIDINTLKKNFEEELVNLLKNQEIIKGLLRETASISISTIKEKENEIKERVEKEVKEKLKVKEMKSISSVVEETIPPLPIKVYEI